MAARYRLGQAATVTLIEAHQPLALVGKGARAALLGQLAQSWSAAGLEPACCRLARRWRGACDYWRHPRNSPLAAGIAAQPWIGDSGLAVENGFVRVGPTLQSETDPAIFAAGDIAHLAHDPRPKAGSLVKAARRRSCFITCGSRQRARHLAPLSSAAGLSEAGCHRRQGRGCRQNGLRLAEACSGAGRTGSTAPSHAEVSCPARDADAGIAARPRWRGYPAALRRACGAKGRRSALERALAASAAADPGDVVQGAGVMRDPEDGHGLSNAHHRSSARLQPATTG